MRIGESRQDELAAAIDAIAFGNAREQGLVTRGNDPAVMPSADDV
jgi:hypothetical protein